MYMNMYARSLNHRSTSSSDGCPKNKYFIVIVQTFNVFITLLVLHVYWRTNAYEEIASYCWIILATITAILVFFAGIKLFICYKEHKNPEGSTPKDRCRRDLLIGYGAISIFGYIPLIVMYIFGYHYPFLVLSAFICYVPPGIIIPLFILQHLRKYQVCREKHSTNCRTACFFIHIIVFIAIAFFVGQLKSAEEFAPYVILYDTLMFSTVRAEFLVILVNGIWLKEQVRQPVVPQEPLRRSSCNLDSGSCDSQDSTSENSIKIAIDHKPGSNATECHICLLRYSSLVIPRILVGCGHTICEKCVGKLPRIGDHQNRVLCPFCRNSTRLPGGKPEQLPKNFTVLDIVVEQRNQRQACNQTDNLLQRSCKSRKFYSERSMQKGFINRIWSSIDSWIYPVNCDVYIWSSSVVRGEFLTVLVNGVWLKQQVRRPVGPQEPLRRNSCNSESSSSNSQDSTSENSVRIDIDHEPSSNATECHICLLRYSSLVIPRILIGCGHTICEKCVAKLPRIGEHQNRVLCPFCRNSTRLPGGKPEQLPKNFAILDIVMEQRNQRKTVESAQE
ncbi:unnamed protein product [Caenorhabditis brenneri]